MSYEIKFKSHTGLITRRDDIFTLVQECFNTPFFIYSLQFFKVALPHITGKQINDFAQKMPPELYKKAFAYLVSQSWFNDSLHHLIRTDDLIDKELVLKSISGIMLFNSPVFRIVPNRDAFSEALSKYDFYKRASTKNCFDILESGLMEPNALIRRIKKKSELLSFVEQYQLNKNIIHTHHKTIHKL